MPASSPRPLPRVLAAAAALALGLVLLFVLGKWTRSQEPGPPAYATRAPASGRRTTDELQHPPSEHTPRARSAQPPPGLPSSPLPSAEESNQVVVLLVDQDEEPIAAASVEITGDGPLGTYTSDELGRCRLPIEPGSGSVLLKVSANGHLPRCIRQGREAQIRIMLNASVHVRGRVVSAVDGAPLAGARVHANLQSCGVEDPVAISDAAGTFEAHGVPLGAGMDWIVSLPGFATSISRLEVSDPRDELVLKLEPGRALEFEVVDFDTRFGIEGARVSRGQALEHTDASGRVRSFGWMVPAEESVSLRIDAEGYASLHATLGTEALRSQAPILAPLPRTAQLELHVLDEDALPVEGVGVRLAHNPLRGRAQRLSASQAPGGPERPFDLPDGWKYFDPEHSRFATTGADGVASFQDLLPDDPNYRVELFAQGGRELSQEIEGTPAPGLRGQLEVRLPRPRPTAVVSGRLLIGGQPEVGSVNWRGATRRGYKLTDQQGRFRLEDVEAGSVTIEGESRRFTSSDDDDPCRERYLPRQDLELVAGESYEVLLDLQVDWGTLSGKVLDARGLPAPGVPVESWSEGSCWLAWMESDDAGRFELEVSPDVPFHRVSAGQGLNFAQLDGVPSNSRDLVLRLPGVARLGLLVVDATSGEALDSFNAQFRGQAGEELDLDTHMRLSNQSLTPDARGRFELSIQPGRYRIEVRDSMREVSTYLPASLDSVLVPLDGVTEVVIPRVRGIELLASLAPGVQPWSSDTHHVVLIESHLTQAVALTDRGWSWGAEVGGKDPARTRHVRPTPGAPARVIGLEPGSYRFKVFPPTIRILPEVIEVEGPGPQTVELRWEPVE